MVMKNELLKKSILELDKAIKSKRMDDIQFDAICKRFEVCFEYLWKHLKQIANDAGVEVYTPKDALKEAVKMKIISNLDLWLDFLQERNLSVHNYYSGNPDETIKKIKAFAKAVKTLK